MCVSQLGVLGVHRTVKPGLLPAMVEANDEVRIVGEVSQYPPPPPTVKGVATHWTWGSCPPEAMMDIDECHR